MGEPTVAAGIVAGILRVAEARGARRDVLLEACGIDPRRLEDQDARLSLASYRALIRAGQRLAGDPALALHYGEATDLAEVSIVGLIGAASETMLHAFAQLQRFYRLMADVDSPPGGRFELERRGDELWLVDRRTDPNAFPEQTEIAFAQMVCGTRQFGVTTFTTEVRVTHPDPGYRGEYERVLGAPVTFDCSENAMRLEQRFLHHPIARQPRYVFGVLCDRAERLLETVAQSETLRGRLEALLLPTLHTGETSADAVAVRLAMSRQTLFRRLRLEGLTYTDVLDQLRHKLALDYLRSRKVSVHETAYLVGFSDPAAFSRAFKRWTGMSPRDVRRPEVEGKEARSPKLNH